ncbi:succinate dehydrogenase [Roseovarius autotrophicus]|uniref:succinate dehydrogenase n=1 Tax=Roseovarius autotrophicus TaxID=2824121 RepID=UPI0019E9A59F|nr:succinate dehydrogenase [Roseovarius autotrophicus]MBE0454927.1 succinate dehydrogenase [Roseovarius sp.]
MRGLLAATALVALGACEASNQVADTIARERAKSVVNSVVNQRFPGVNSAPVTDCIIDAASAREIVQIAGASVSGISPEITQKVIEIARRPEATRCIAQNSLILLGG